MILNLKKLNQYANKIHFKMDTLNTVIKLIEKDCYMASINLKDAYYSVSITPTDRKYLHLRSGVHPSSSLVCLMACPVLLGNLLNFENLPFLPFTCQAHILMTCTYKGKHTESVWTMLLIRSKWWIPWGLSHTLTSPPSSLRNSSNFWVSY